MGRAPCCDKEGLKKGPWTPEEDQKLIDYIEKHGPGNWRSLPKKEGLLRCGKSCRLRWINYLRPDIKRGRFSFEEETIIRFHSVLGNKWSAIAAKLPGRTDNEIKNYWNTQIRKRLLRMGIDPVTHGPRLDVLDVPSIVSSLQNSSLLNMPALLNLQMLLNPDLLRLASSLASSQYSIPISQNQNLSQSSNFGNSLPQNPTYPNVQIASQSKLPVQHIQSFDDTDVKPNLGISNIKAVQSGLKPNGQVNAEPSFDCYAPNHVTQYSTSDHSALDPLVWILSTLFKSSRSS